MIWSPILGELIGLDSLEKEEIQEVKNKYKVLKDEVRDRCTHKCEDGKSAIRSERWRYNDYHSVCQICGREV